MVGGLGAFASPSVVEGLPVIRHLPGIAGRSVFIVRDASGAAVACVRAGDETVASLPAADGSRVDIVQDRGGRRVVRSLDPRRYRPGCLALDQAQFSVRPGLFGYYEEAPPEETDGQDTLTWIVDVLVAYDEPAVDWLKSRGLDAGVFAELQVAKMNAVLENSGLLDDFRFRLVGTRSLELNVRKKGGSNLMRFESVLSSLKSASSQTLRPGNDLRGLVAARHDSGADVAVLLVDTGSTTGTLGASYGLTDSPYGWDSPANLAARGRLAFAVCEIGAVESGQVMTHEVGHVLGAGHPSPTQVNPASIDCGPQLFSYSSAHLFDYGGARRFTIMGYPFDGYGHDGFLPVESFSSPALTYRDAGEDTGVPLGVEGVSDNVLTIRRAYASVAKYRQHVLPDDDLVETHVRVTATEGGTVSGGGLYFSGETAIVKAVCNSGFCFAGWHVVDSEGQTNVLASVDDYRALACSVPVGRDDMDLVAVFVRKNRTADPVTGIGILFDPSDFRAGVAVDLSPAFDAESGSRPSFSVSGLPTGLKWTAGSVRIYGTPTKPGLFKVKVTAKNQSGATASTVVWMAVANWRDPVLPFAESYGPFVPGEPMSLDFHGFAWGCSASGLPSGVKWKSSTGILSGTPTKPGTNVVVFTRTDRELGSGERVTHKASFSFVTGPKPVLTLEPCGTGTGKLTGGGAYVANKKVTLRAVQDTRDAAATSKKAATRKSAFAGWWSDAGELLSLETSYAFVMPTEDTVVRGKFVTAEEDAASLSLEAGGVPLEPGVPLVLTNLCGVAFDLPLSPSALSRTTVSVSGLPSGLKYDKKTLRVTGAPTSASRLNAKTGVRTPAKIRMKVTTVGKSAETFAIDLFVMPLPAWAVGTFNGGGEARTAKLTVTSSGRISGKMLEGSSTWTLSAASFASGAYDPVVGAVGLSADVIGKCGRASFACPVDFADDGLSGSAESDLFATVRSLWTTADYKAFAKKLTAAGTVTGTVGADVFDFRFTTSGTVTAKGSFASGYKASASAPLCVIAPPEEGFRALAWLHYPPVPSRKFEGFDACFEVDWKGGTVDVTPVAEDDDLP